MLVADQTFHGSKPLTYGSDGVLVRGQVVTVPLKRKHVLGLVDAAVGKPQFAVKLAVAHLELPPVPAPLMALLDWMRDYYPAPLGITTQLFLPKSLPAKPLPPLELAAPIITHLPALNAEQTQAMAAIKQPGLHLLHGETGSGKTRVYIERTLQCINHGRSALILTPEIGLTSQLANDFRAVFGNRVFLVHSGLTDAQRQRVWQAMLQTTEPLVVIGARSALFSPLSDIGLIVVDEAHEGAYKQDQAPHYHASTIAAKLADLHKATLVLGSATPLVSDYYIATAKKRPIIRLKEQAVVSEHGAPQIDIIDLRDRAQFTKSSFLSNQLLTAIGQSLQSGEQSLLFLNRRGTARVIFCDNCGWQALCPHCDLPLVYHGDEHLMRCHSCDHKARVPGSCPQCRNASVVFKSIGTKAVYDEVARLFPGARVQRFDTDNKKAERIEQHYDSVHSGDVDILIGTQTLAKGLDLPKLGLVGVIAADTGLYFPDFTAQERTYQLLTQVIGRVGRGHRAGRAIVQTYGPDSPLLAAALTKDWSTFYNAEITERRTYRFPPFCYLLKLTVRRASLKSAQTSSTALAVALASEHPRVRVEGPAPAFHEHVLGKFTWQLIVKANRRSDLLDIIAALPAGWTYDIDPTNLL